MGFSFRSMLPFWNCRDGTQWLTLPNINVEKNSKLRSFDKAESEQGVVQPLIKIKGYVHKPVNSEKNIINLTTK